MKIITIQHTESIHHTNGMIGSWTDWDLSEKGIKQAHNIGKKLSNELEEEYILYTSDLKRASQTADIVASYLNVKPIVRTELKERNLGSAVGKSVDWLIKNQLPYKFDIDHKCLEDAESVREHWDRLACFYNAIMKSKHENIIIVSHGGSLSIFNAMWMKLSVEDLNKVNIHGRAGGVSKFVRNDDGVHFVKGISDMSYIK